MRTQLHIVLGTAVVAAGMVGSAAAAGLDGMFLELLPGDAAVADRGSASAAVSNVLAWKINKGTHQGVSLNDLAVVAIVSDLSADVAERPARARAVLLVDSKADARQREALVDLAQTLTKDAKLDVVAVESRKIDLRIGEGCSLGAAVLDAEIVKAKVRRAETAASVAADRPGQQAGGRSLASAYYRRQATAAEFAFAGCGPGCKAEDVVPRTCSRAVVGGF